MIRYPVKTNKYHNKKVVIDGIVFASKLEATRYKELKLLEHKGIIKDLVLQPSYDLIPSFKKDNKTYRKTTYKADFSYYDNEEVQEMSLKDDIKDVQKETKDVKEQVKERSLAMEILHDLKVENMTLKILLGISILVNVLIAIIK